MQTCIAFVALGVCYALFRFGSQMLLVGLDILRTPPHEFKNLCKTIRLCQEANAGNPSARHALQQEATMGRSFIKSGIGFDAEGKIRLLYAPNHAAIHENS